MRRALHLLPLTVLAMGLLTGCPKKPDTTAVDSETEGTGPAFVNINMEEDVEDADFLELMTYTAECGNLKQLEPSAMMGKLSDAEIRCLDKQLKDADKQTHKDKLSRVLMADAWSKGNKDRWEDIVRRHLNDIDRSDPDLCYKFALHTQKKGPNYADETMKWADTALENRTFWKGDVHVSRVYNLYRLKATASMEKWEWLEQKYLKEPSEDLQKDKQTVRNQAKTFAREWLEYARSSGKDDTMAMQMCVSAAGTREFCENAGQ